MPSSPQSDIHSFSVVCEGSMPDRAGCPRASQREWVKVLSPKIKMGRWPTTRGMVGVSKGEMKAVEDDMARRAAQIPLSHVAVSLGVNVQDSDMFRPDYMFDPIVAALRDLGWIHPDDAPSVTIAVMCDNNLPFGTLVQVVDIEHAQEEVDDDIMETIKRIAERVDAIAKRVIPEDVYHIPTSITGPVIPSDLDLSSDDSKEKQSDAS